MTALPVLWVYGPSGVGKTTVTWELFGQLVREGVPTGYVDTDQLGMCYGPPTPHCWAPEPGDDPGRHLLKARTLDAVVMNFRDAGARCVVAPGVTDPVRGVETDLLPHAALTACRLRVEPVDLGRRLAARGNPADDVATELAYADALDRATATGPCVDTTGLTVAEVVARVRNRTGWPDLAAPVHASSPEPRVPDRTPGEILWLCGPAAVGKSTVGWLVYQQIRRAGVGAAFVDLDQIGFHRPVPPRRPGKPPPQSGQPRRAVAAVPGRRGGVPGRSRAARPGATRGAVHRRVAGCHDHAVPAARRRDRPRRAGGIPWPGPHIDLGHGR